MKIYAILIIILLIFFLVGCNNKQDNDIQDNIIKDSVKEIPIKYSNSTEGCVGEGYHLITPSIQEEWETRKNLKCCEGLTAISEAEYPTLFTKDCEPAEGSGDLCSNCGNGICEDWESKCSCKEDCVECSQIYDQIENDLKNANYCQTDSDCQVLILGGPYIEFGCYHYINKKFDKEEFDSRMIDYFRQCGVMIDECASTPKVACVSGKCVEKEGNF